MESLTVENIINHNYENIVHPQNVYLYVNKIVYEKSTDTYKYYIFGNSNAILKILTKYNNPTVTEFIKKPLSMVDKGDIVEYYDILINSVVFPIASNKIVLLSKNNQFYIPEKLVSTLSIITEGIQEAKYLLSKDIDMLKYITGGVIDTCSSIEVYYNDRLINEIKNVSVIKDLKNNIFNNVTTVLLPIDWINTKNSNMKVISILEFYKIPNKSLNFSLVKIKELLKALF